MDLGRIAYARGQQLLKILIIHIAKTLAGLGRDKFCATTPPAVLFCRIRVSFRRKFAVTV